MLDICWLLVRDDRAWHCFEGNPRDGMTNRPFLCGRTSPDDRTDILMYAQMMPERYDATTCAICKRAVKKLS